MGIFKNWIRKVRGVCPECGGTKDKRGLAQKFIESKMRGVECQDSFHGERTIQPGAQCFDKQGNSVSMPD